VHGVALIDIGGGTTDLAIFLRTGYPLYRCNSLSEEM
jgi:cell division ATPase FtsA